MSTLHVKRPVACPVAQAPAHLERFFQEHAKEGVAIVRLRAPLEFLGLPALLLERDCVVKLQPVHVAGAMIQQYRVTWESAEGGPYPKFDGMLSIENDEDYTTCILALDGSYEPPLGAAGVVFDVAIGHKIAETTASDFLNRVAAYLEKAYHEAEARKTRPAAGDSPLIL